MSDPLVPERNNRKSWFLAEDQLCPAPNSCPIVRYLETLPDSPVAHILLTRGARSVGHKVPYCCPPTGRVVGVSLPFAVKGRRVCRVEMLNGTQGMTR